MRDAVARKLLDDRLPRDLVDLVLASASFTCRTCHVRTVGRLSVPVGDFCSRACYLHV